MVLSIDTKTFSFFKLLTTFPIFIFSTSKKNFALPSDWPFGILIIVPVISELIGAKLSKSSTSFSLIDVLKTPK